MKDLTAKLNDFIGRINEILSEDVTSGFTLERIFRTKQSLVDPVVATLEDRPELADAAVEVRRLFQAVEEYVVCFSTQPERIIERRKRIEGLKAVVRRRLLTDDDHEGEVELLLDDIRRWQWKTSLDASGRLVYATADGKQVPGRGAITEKVGPAVIEKAVKALRPYSEKIRPRDVRGEPGGLVVINNCKHAIVVGDLHGRYDNLEHILKDKNNLEAVLAGEAHLIFLGDAVHPRSSALNDSRAYEDSFCTMLLIMTLKAENPFNVHYLLGNHDHSHIGGWPAGRGNVRQDTLFEEFIVKQFGEAVFEHYREFVRCSPLVLKVKAPNGYVLMVHAGLPQGVLHTRGLINITVKGPQGPELQDLLWSRKYDDREMMATCLKNVGAKLMVVGHTPPTKRRAERYGLEVIAESVFAHVHHLQVIANAQNNTFGYLDVDMTRRLPDDVTHLLAPNKKSAFRVFRPTKPAADAPETPSGSPDDDA